MKKQIQVGIIGTGTHGSRYANHIVKDLGHCFTLTAISRRSDEAVGQAKKWRTELFPDWRDLVCSKNVDAVIAVTTPNLNPEIGRLCAQENKPLLLEKPLTTDYRTANELVTLFRAQTLPLTVAHTLRYNSVIQGLKSYLPNMGRTFSFCASHRLEPSTIGWLEDPVISGGGVIYHTAVHLFDAIRYITGEEIVKIRATAVKIINPGVEDLLTAQLELSNGAIGTMDTSKVSPARQGRYEFTCRNGQLYGDQIHGYLEKISQASITKLPVEPPAPALIPLLRDWYEYLRGTGENPIGGQEGLAAVKVCDSCKRSIETGEWVNVDQL